VLEKAEWETRAKGQECDALLTLLHARELELERHVQTEAEKEREREGEQLEEAVGGGARDKVRPQERKGKDQRNAQEERERDFVLSEAHGGGRRMEAEGVCWEEERERERERREELERQVVELERHVVELEETKETLQVVVHQKTQQVVCVCVCGVCLWLCVFILEARLIAPLFVCRFCLFSALLVRISGLYCVRGVFRIFIDRKLSNLSALLVLSPVNV